MKLLKSIFLIAFLSSTAHSQEFTERPELEHGYVSIGFKYSGAMPNHIKNKLDYVTGLKDVAITIDDLSRSDDVAWVDGKCDQKMCEVKWKQKKNSEKKTKVEVDFIPGVAGVDENLAGTELEYTIRVPCEYLTSTIQLLRKND